MSADQPTALTIFAGAGGADLGLQRAGFEHTRCIEFDKNAHATLCAAGFPGVLGDVRDPRLYRDLPPIDLLWASPPCQDWSSAGKRKGAGGSRNGWPWSWAVVRHLQRRGLGPTWFIAENVTGMLTHNGAACGSGCCADPNRCPATYWHEVIMREAAALFPWAGYEVLDAADHGTPQFRRRVFLVAGPRPIRWPVATHGPPGEARQASLFGAGVKPWTTVRDALGLDGALDLERGAGMAERHGERRHHPTTEPAPTLRSRTGGAGAIRFIRTEQRDTMPAPTVPTVGNQYLHAGNPGTRAGSEPERLDRPAPTVTTTEYKGSPDAYRPDQQPKMQKASDALYLATGRRRLTVQECAALFSMPPDYPWQGTQTSQYKQVGNMCAWEVVAALGRAVLDAAP